MKLLQDLINIYAPSGDEIRMKEFLINYVKENAANWKVQPEVLTEGMQDCLMLKFGKPRTAIFAHMDSIGFTVRYGNELVKIGGPKTISGSILYGYDSKGYIEAELEVGEIEKLSYKAERLIDPGTALCFKSDFRETEEYVQSCYMDNRLGIDNALKVAET